MRYFKGIATLILLGTLTLSACSSDNEAADCERDQHALIASVESETLTVAVNYDLPLDVIYGIENSCGAFKKFEIEKNGFDWNIKVINHYTGCECSEVYRNETQKLYFRVTQPGTYTLTFTSPDGSAIQKVIIVT
ncbi:hypothetical protein [Paenimyroides ceti]